MHHADFDLKSNLVFVDGKSYIGKLKENHPDAVDVSQSTLNKLHTCKNWALSEKRCPCDIHFYNYVDDVRMQDKSIFHYGDI